MSPLLNWNSDLYRALKHPPKVEMHDSRMVRALRLHFALSIEDFKPAPLPLP